MPNSSSVTDHVCPHDSSKCNNGGAEHCMLHWAELNCTACKKCSFCANNRTAEGASGFCVEHCCYFRSIKLKKLNMSTLEFLVFLHCSYSTYNTASEKQLALHSWHVCKRKKKVVFGKCKRPRPESLTRAHLPPFSSWCTPEIALICVEMASSRFRFFGLCFQTADEQRVTAKFHPSGRVRCRKWNARHLRWQGTGKGTGTRDQRLDMPFS